jgi:hypothetical protein
MSAGEIVFFIHKDHVSVSSPFFYPDLQKWRNRPSIISDQGQTPRESFQQAGSVIVPQPPIAAAQAVLDEHVCPDVAVGI